MSVSNFPPDELCIPFPELPTVEDICFPGGVCLSYIWDGINKIPSLADMPMDFFSQIGPAMTPLKPFFDLLNTIIQLFKCLMAIPKAFFTLDPSELLECFPALIELINNLLKLIPQLSIPKMVIAILKNLAALMRALASDVRYIQSQVLRVADMIDRAAVLGDRKMNGFLVCIQEDLGTTLLSTSEALQGLGSIIIIVNIFIGMFGGPEIPCFGSIIRDNPDAFDLLVEILTTIADVLTTIANSIPDPDLILTLALGNQKC